MCRNPALTYSPRRAAFPMDRDAMLVDGLARNFFQKTDTASLLLGQQWMPPQLGPALQRCHGIAPV